MENLRVDCFFDISQWAHAFLFEGCVYPWQALQKLSKYLQEQSLGNICIDVPSSVFLGDPASISIGRETIIEPGAYIQGPCVIGERCTIRNGAYIRGNVIVGEGCVIGHGTEIKHSILLNRASTAHFNYVGDTILGNEVNLGAGVKCANVRLDRENIFIYSPEGKIPTGLKKLGAIVGDRAQVGCNCVLNPGTLLGKSSFCFPCLNIYGIVPKHAKVKPVQKNIVEC